ncbi:hypothetical protein IAE22_31775, partial [Bacillus sp. S34]|nr:hypothetical protein [Bacillus sp. S34]
MRKHAPDNQPASRSTTWVVDQYRWLQGFPGQKRENAAWPRPVRKVAQRLLRTPVLHRLTGLRQPVDLRELDMVARADELHVPILLMHSDDAGFDQAAGDVCVNFYAA